MALQNDIQLTEPADMITDQPTGWDKFISGFTQFTGALGNLGLSLNFPKNWGGINPTPSGYPNPGSFPERDPNSGSSSALLWVGIILAVIVFIVILYLIFRKK